MQLRIGAKVISLEGKKLGRLAYLLLNPEDWRLDSLVVGAGYGWLAGPKRLIPANLDFYIEPSGVIRLSISKAEYIKLNLYWGYHLEYYYEDSGPSPLDDEPWWLRSNSQAIYSTYRTAYKRCFIERVRNYDPELIRVGSRTQLELKDGALGQVREFCFGAAAEWAEEKSGHFLLSLRADFDQDWARKITLPFDWLGKINDEQFSAELDLEELRDRVEWIDYLIAQIGQPQKEPG